MTTRFSPKSRLRIAAAAAVVTVTAAIATVVTSTSSDPTAISSQLWSVEASEILGREFAIFRSPLVGTEFNMDMGGFIDAGSLVVTMIGMPDRQAYSLDDAELVALDADDGTVRWRTSAVDVGGCSETLLGSSVLCFSGPYVSGGSYSLFDIETGERRDIKTPWAPIIAVVSGDTVLALEGDIESNDVRVHSGTVDDPEANWSKAFDVGGSWEAGYVDPVMSVHGDLGVIALDESLGFDLKTGEQRWVHGYSTCSTAHTSSDGVTLVSDGGCEGNGRPTSEYALDQYGREFARTDELPSESSYYGGRYSRDDPAGRSTPIILGHSGFDRTSGEKLWSNSELFDTAQSLAVIGNVVAVTRSGSEPEVQFVDLLTGEVLWRSNAERAGEVVWHGDVVIDEGNVYGTDVRTGQRSWEIRVDQDGDDEFTPWVMPRELWAGEKVLLRSSEDRITALKLS